MGFLLTCAAAEHEEAEAAAAGTEEQVSGEEAAPAPPRPGRGLRGAPGGALRHCVLKPSPESHRRPLLDDRLPGIQGHLKMGNS